MAVDPIQVAKLRADAALGRAQLARVREQLASGELVDVEESDRRLFDEARKIRDVILAAPARYAAELAAELDVPTWQMLQQLNGGVRGLLAWAADHGPLPRGSETDGGEIAPETPPEIPPPKRKRRSA